MSLKKVLEKHKLTAMGQPIHPRYLYVNIRYRDKAVYCVETKINLLYRGGGSSVVRRRKFEANGRGYEPQLNQKNLK